MTESKFADVAPMPAAMGQAPGPGHNNPPVEEVVKADFKAELLRERPDFMTKLKDIVEAADRIKVENDDDLARAGVFEKTIRAAERHIDETHVTVKAPFLAGGRAVDAEKKRLTARLDKTKQQLKRHMNAYYAKREAERAAAEAKRQADERAAAAAREDAWIEDAVPASPAARAEDHRVRSDEGVTVSGTTVWNSQVIDYDAAYQAVRSDPKVKEAIDASVKRLVRAGQRDMPWVRVWDTIEARSR